jgi:hypothetical protein
VSYSLLAPQANDSATEGDEDDPKGRHLGQAGRHVLQWAWIEAAHGAVRAGGRFRAMFDRVTEGGKRNRNRGYIVVAHELCRLGYVLWKKDMDYTDARPARPGERGNEEDSRPGMGQPVGPMVADPR